jgi:hypothetical protein
LFVAGSPEPPQLEAVAQSPADPTGPFQIAVAALAEPAKASTTHKHTNLFIIKLLLLKNSLFCFLRKHRKTSAHNKSL